MTTQNDISPTAAEARAIGITGDHWPYGPNIDHQARRDLVDWATPLRLRHHRRARCVDWLRRGRCSCPGSCALGSWFDHPTSWTRNGRPAVLVAQPYGLSGDHLAALADIHQSGLHVHIDGTGWYGHHTTFITIWAVDPTA